MQTVYAYSGRDLAESRRALSVMVRTEFTEGDVEVQPSHGEVRSVIRKGLSQPILFMRSVNAADISFRRCWHHIRARRAAVRLLYFVFQGEMRISSPAGSYAVRPGQCALINADEPFYSGTFVGDRGTFECGLAVVPEHLVLSQMPWARQLNTSFEIAAAYRPVVTSLLEILSTEGDCLSRRTAEALADGFLKSVADGMENQISAETEPPGVMDRRFADIQACIRRYLTSADLTCERVAQYCGISPRYLCHVLKAHDTSFSLLLWSQRLPKARDWLASEAYRGYPIRKIAGMAGFKSAAHFSRMFKSAYRVSPKEYRARQTAGESDPRSAASSESTGKRQATK